MCRSHHLIVQSFLHHQGVSFEVEKFLRVHCDPERDVIAGANLHQLDVSCVVLRDGHGARRDGAHWDRVGTCLNV